MKFPHTNKIRKDIEERVGDNLKLLEERLGEINWKIILKGYVYFFGILLVSIFLLLVIIRLAFKIF